MSTPESTMVGSFGGYPGKSTMVSWASAAWVDDAFWMELARQPGRLVPELGEGCEGKCLQEPLYMMVKLQGNEGPTWTHVDPAKDVQRDPPPKTMGFFSERISDSGWERWNMRRGSCAPGGVCTWYTVLTTIECLLLMVVGCYNHHWVILLNFAMSI